MARKGKSRKLNAKVLALCEGQTEQNYLLEVKNTLPRQKQRGLMIEIETHKQNEPLNLVREAVRRKDKARREGAPYDHVWVVFDHDNLPNRGSAFQEAGKEEIRIAFSSLNIEFWFLLHFRYTTRSFRDGDGLKDLVRNECIPKYRPPKTRLLPHLAAREEEAMKRAERLRQSQQAEIDQGTALWNLNPYVTIDRLVQFIRTLGKE